MYEIPLEQQIQRHILYDSTFASHMIDWSELPLSANGCVADVQDGSVNKSHPELSKPRSPSDPRRLAFAVYADDVEVVNPIGAARTKHKVTLYYASVLNVPSHLRMELDYIFLLAVVLAKQQSAAGCQRVMQGDGEDYVAGCTTPVISSHMHRAPSLPLSCISHLHGFFTLQS